ncbi:MAG: bifunctional diaminohydroxyphosphoribosylaminopyrimidine deaminase/5-amino-6-(5-phosphoribosylamino)uracil reductase RibD [Dehalococcoidia bacterium]|nr:bifunctional diaminohydroxyphosphoribosylaminopyrimidine deaminase/5-amino-6-(5-phosphoribosylamino)uracil reductase RibD [Dehalococcoidia bacterium]
MDYMKRALTLAKGVVGSTSPNPPVGAVLVKGDRVIGEGATQPPGGSHAEVVALRQAGDAAKGATLYVTLEPHNFQGRTSPCTQAIIAAGVAEVHIATLDPNPRVAGQGKAQLEAAGIRVVMAAPDETDEATELIEAHSHWITTDLPLVVVKYAMTLDGKIATVTGDSRWITGEEARAQVHTLRLACDAILVGINTAVRDNPQLTARDAADKPLPKQPLRVVVDTQGNLPLTARMLKEPGKTLVAVANASPVKKAALIQARAEVLEVPAQNGSVDLRSLLQQLGKRQVTSVLVEGGGTLLSSLFALDLVDKVYTYIAPCIVGGREAPTPVEGAGIPSLASAVTLERVRSERVGNDILIVGYPRKSTWQKG